MILEEDGGLVLGVLTAMTKARESQGGVPSADDAALSDLVGMLDG